MTTTLIVMLLGFSVVFYLREIRTAKIISNKSQQALLLNQQIKELHQKIEKMHKEEVARLKEDERRKRLREENDISCAENQMKFIGQCTLYATRPVNKEASQVIYALEEWIANHQPTWRFSFEVGMGAFIKTLGNSNTSLNKKAFSSYNSKRVDFLLIDRFGNPVLAIEYNGSGHYLSDTADDRMEVKRFVLKRAQIPLLEISEKMSKERILTRLCDVLHSYLIETDSLNS